MASDEFQTVVAEVSARSNARRKATVAQFVQILQRMHAKGTHTYSISVVGKECEAQDVITTQAIRNATGADYRLIIEAFARDVGASTTHSVNVRQTPLEEAINSIADKDIRTRLRYLLAEVKALRNENNTLSAAFKRLSFKAHESTASVSAPPLLSSPVNATEIQPPPQFDTVPLADFISDRWIDKKGWIVDSHGTIRDENNDRMTPNGFVPALRTALEYLRRRS
ncbi:gamma-mobile-trio protein GmtX [Microvirga sp. P5_D2]